MKYPIRENRDLEFRNDHWVCYEIATPIGAVDVQIDADDSLPKEVTDEIKRILELIPSIDDQARGYLEKKAKKDIDGITLVEPSLLLNHDFANGRFTLFYSNSDEEDLTCYGVEFRKYEPFDLSIGD